MIYSICRKIFWPYLLFLHEIVISTYLTFNFLTHFVKWNRNKILAYNINRYPYYTITHLLTMYQQHSPMVRFSVVIINKKVPTQNIVFNAHVLFEMTYFNKLYDRLKQIYDWKINWQNFMLLKNYYLLKLNKCCFLFKLNKCVVKMKLESQIY